MSSSPLRETVERFLAACRRPAVLEPGEPPILMESGSYLLSESGSKLLVEAWDERANLHRRVREVQRESPGRLTLLVERFGRGAGTIELVDMDRASVRPAVVRAARQGGAEALARLLARQFPAWKRRECTVGADLEHTLSPAFARGFATHGRQGLAALLAPRGSDPLHALSFGLLWLDYLRQREQDRAVAGLALFVPESQARSVLNILPGLDATRIRLSLFACNEDGTERQVDTHDAGNVASELAPAPARTPDAPPAQVLELASREEVETFSRGGGLWSFRVRGLEFARWERGRLWLTLERAIAQSPRQVTKWVTRLAEMRSADARNRHHPWYLRKAEAWLEAETRAHIERVDPSLCPGPLYGQVVARLGRDRGVADIVAIDRGGRLALMELKASQDPHLPLQALDYWVRLRRHAADGGLQRAGYFPDVQARPEPPRLLLVAPAMEFHPSTERLLSFYHPDVDVERVGLGVEWRKSLRVILRVRGAERPEWDAEDSLGEHGGQLPSQHQTGLGFVEPGGDPGTSRT